MGEVSLCKLASLEIANFIKSATMSSLMEYLSVPSFAKSMQKDPTMINKGLYATTLKILLLYISAYT